MNTSWPVNRFVYLLRIFVVVFLFVTLLVLTLGVPRAEALTTTRVEDCRSTTLTEDNCSVVYYIVMFTNALAIMVGAVVVLSIVISGIQYMTAGDNPQKVAKAKHRIMSALLALLVFLFMWAFLQWVVPGGLL